MSNSNFPDAQSNPLGAIPAYLAQGGAAVSAFNPLQVQGTLSVGSGYTITQTTVAVTATSGALIAANSSRKYLGWMNVGANPVTVTPGASAAVFGTGQIYAAGGAGQQGASEEFPNGAPLNAFQCICDAGKTSTIIVWEGN
jgi:hypothetical protein